MKLPKWLDRLWNILRGWFGSTHSDESDSSQPDQGQTNPSPDSGESAQASTRKLLTWIPSGPNGWPCVQSESFEAILNTDLRRYVFIIQPSQAIIVATNAMFALQRNGSYLFHADWQLPLSKLPEIILVECLGYRFRFDSNDKKCTVEAVG
jgi:hypothetical protein